MRQGPRRETMHAEYDIRGGVRGKYFARYRGRMAVVDHAAWAREIHDDLYTLAQSMAERGLFVRDDFGEPSIMALRELDRLVRAVEVEALEKVAQRLDAILARRLDRGLAQALVILLGEIAAEARAEAIKQTYQRAAAAVRALKP